MHSNPSVPSVQVSLVVSLALAACHSSSDEEPAPQPAPLVVNLGRAATQLFGAGDLRLVAVSEAGEGRDLDGDDDTTGVVLHILDLETQALVNTGLAFPKRFRRDEVPPPEFGCNDELAVFQVSEEETGQDLDGDGIANEVTTWTFDGRTGALRGFSFAHAQMFLDGDLAALSSFGAGFELVLHAYDGRDGSLSMLPFEPSALMAAGDRIVVFTVAELGAADLNADGDTNDFLVVHLYDADSRRVLNTSFDTRPGPVRVVAGFAGFSVSEAQHGGLDLNGDGDARDQVFVAVDPRGGRTRILGSSGVEYADFVDRELFLLTVAEDGTDLNADGDGEDRVALAYDPASDRVIDTGLAVSSTLLVRAGRWLGVPVYEPAQGNLDLDRDGRIESNVLHVVDTRTGRSLNLGVPGLWIGALDDQLLGLRFHDEDGVPESELVVWDGRSLRGTGFATGSVAGTAAGRSLLVVSESEEDLNGDEDTDDFVYVLYDGRTGTVRSLGLATTTFEGSLGPGGRAAVLVSEGAQGADLNGDDDQLDQVLHLIVVDGPQG